MLITILAKRNPGIQIPPRRVEQKPEDKRTESIPPIGVSISQAAKLLNIGKPLMYNLIKTGKIRATKLGKRVIVSVQSLREFIDGKKEPCDSIENTGESQGKDTE
jgi:excisionase family DNA binding protein